MRGGSHNPYPSLTQPIVPAFSTRDMDSRHPQYPNIFAAWESTLGNTRKTAPVFKNLYLMVTQALYKQAREQISYNPL